MEKQTQAEQWLQEGPSKEDVKATDQAVEKSPAPSAPVFQEIKGLLGLAYPDLVAVATSACDAWTRGQTQVWVVPYAALNTDARAPQVSPNTVVPDIIAMLRCFEP